MRRAPQRKFPNSPFSRRLILLPTFLILAWFSACVHQPKTPDPYAAQVTKYCIALINGDPSCGKFTFVNPSEPGALDFYNFVSTHYYDSPDQYVRLDKAISGLDISAHPDVAATVCPGKPATFSGCLITHLADPSVCYPAVAGGQLSFPAGCQAVGVIFPVNGVVGSNGEKFTLADYRYGVFVHGDINYALLIDEDEFRSALQQAASNQ
jgi:hypothetical protein